jgi:hypothetical protein
MAGSDPLETLYDAHAGALFAYALNLTRSDADARDLHGEEEPRPSVRLPAPAFSSPRSDTFSTNRMS